MIKKIIRYPTLSLRRITKQVEFPLSQAVLEHICDLKETLAATPYGIALASNQILADGHRIFVTKVGLQVPKVASMMSAEKLTQSIPELVINPTWEVYTPHEIDTHHPYDASEHFDFVEGCLSLPELNSKISRQMWVEMLYQDETGEKFIYVARNLGARIIQHECDHLDGKLIYDHVPKNIQLTIKIAAIRNRKKGKH